MDDFPSRRSNSDNEFTKRYVTYRSVIGLIGVSQVAFGFLGVFLGFGVGIFLELNFLFTGLLGALILTFGFRFAMRSYIAKDDKAMDLWDESKREEQEKEFQRKLAEAKASGDFNRFGED